MPAAGQTSRRSAPQAASRATREFRASVQQNGVSRRETRPNTAPLSDDQIRTALARTLESPEFHSVPQLRAFLDYVVKATLDNDREKIKGYTIAVGALGRPDDFNPVTDPIVRVEAARLRRRLTKYYEGSGSSDPIHITIPKGSYAPDFHAAPAGSSCEEPLAGHTEDHPVSAGQPPPPPRSTVAPDEAPDATGGVNIVPAAASGAADLPGLPRHFVRFLPTMPALPVRNTMRHRIPLPFALAFGLACFLAGFLAASQ
ncbi:hypothetical protein [Roseibium salinum]|uniref:Uncharacterized protein n=1 Tax=Roseibium salinum TaxID=1604349 RepID=A0ABT3R3T0_9HYPH|nr:hypothetical protein [Roseibium sp. DSM 29163]MCX2723868.1 hypothetical protein [Roseibium sp. DSM 29163]